MRRVIRKRGLLALFLGSILYSASAANVLTNPGFETALIGWSPYGPNSYSQTNSTVAHGGSNYFKVYGNFSAADNWAGVFQDLPSGQGAVYSADGWAYSLASDAIHGQDQFWLEVTFRDIAANTLALYRSDLITGTNITAYGLSTWFDLRVTNQWGFYNSGGVPVGTVPTNTVTSLVAPPGTWFVRWQIVFHQGPDNANGSAYFDDCVLNQISGPTGPPASAWNIVWSDEFSGTNIDLNTWVFEAGGGGWGNSELEFYTGRPQNAYVTNGLLHIVAQRETTNTYSYTSARMKTQGHFAKAYGRFEFRAKLPAGLGYWPALWMLGANFPTVGWPACGEIDVMENNGSILNQVQGTIHYSDAQNHHLQSTGYYPFPGGNSVTNFHSYTFEWGTNMVRWYVDGLLYETQTSWSSSTGPYPAPFNQPFFIIMNLAVGGSYLGNPSIATINANTVFPGDMQVDYVRVWDLTAPLQLSLTRSNGNFVLSWPANIVCHLQAQTNSTGLSSSWADIPAATNPYLVPPVPQARSVFYRLQSP
jgi:beta-glucanase (GH16 family)